MIKDSLLNRRLNGFYIESLLGRGGMARVYRGIDLNLQRYVAIKVIDAPYRNDPNHINRFAREARVIAQLGQHSNVVKVYHYGEDHGYLFMAMQYIQGADLGAVMRSYRQDNLLMPFDEILRITWDVCDALDYIHSQGVIHRDLKPSNIMLDPEGRAVLTDFGLALITETGTLGEAFGSPHYIPPEQVISSAHAVAQSDLYSLGVILYELFTGRLPFESDNPMNLAMLHMSQPPPSPRSFRPELTPAIEAVILKTLAKQPDERYASGRELYAELERAVRSAQPTAANPQANQAHLTVPFRVQQESRPLPPPRVPQEAAQAAPPPPPAQQPASTQRPAYQAPAPTGPMSRPAPAYQPPPPPPTYAEPLVIPIPNRQKNRGCLTRLALPLALMLAAVLLCAGGGYALSRMDFGLGGFGPGSTPTRLTAVAEDPAATKTPEPSATPRPTDTPPQPTNTPEVSPTPEGPTFELMLVKFGDGYLIVANNGETTFPLDPLQLGSGRAAIPGYAWGISDLEPGDCVVAMKATRRPNFPDNPGCMVLAVLEGDPQAAFWDKTFDVFYEEERVGECKKNENSCVVQIPVFR